LLGPFYDRYIRKPGLALTYVDAMRRVSLVKADLRLVGSTSNWSTATMCGRRAKWVYDLVS